MVYLSFAVVFITTTVLTLFGIYQYSQTSTNLRNQLESSLFDTVERLAYSLSNPFYSFHDEGIRDIILSEMKNGAIVGIYIFDSQSENIHYGFERIGEEVNEVTKEKTYENSLNLKKDIVFENLNLGKVNVFMTSDLMESQLRAILITDITQIVILDICLVILMIILLRSKVVIPITRLTKNSSDIADGVLYNEIEVKSNDEIGILAEGFSVMQDSIKNQIKDLKTENNERGKAEVALKESEEKYRVVVDNLFEAITIVKNGKLIYFNNAATKLFGYSKEEFYDLPYEDTIHPSDRKMVTERLHRRQKGEELIDFYSFRIVTKEHKIKWVEIKPVIINWENDVASLTFITDITERKRMEEMMIQTEKMMSLGGLTAGMAHELNNPLGGILLGIQNIERRLSPGLKKNIETAVKYNINLVHLENYLKERKILNYLNGVKESGQRAATIIKDMLQFSRKSETKMRFVYLDEMAESVLDMAGKDFDLKKKHDFRNIDIIKKFDPNLPAVECAKSEIEQVLLNLLKNAAQAMIASNPQGSHQIIIRMLKVEKMVRIEIEDNGPGIDEATRKRVFEPFFTTKPVGEGTGLGLSVSYMIVTNNHNGTMEVESDDEIGTKFIIQLPFTHERNA